jgi:hypothetical protein
MSRQWYVMLPAMAALLAGCAAEDRSATQSPETTGASTPSPTPQAVLTEACPLLSNDDLTRLLNNGRDANLTATEASPEDDDGSKIYKCLYGNGRATALELVAREFPADGATAATTIDAIGEASGTTPVPVTGVGEAAVFYPTADGAGVVLAGAKMSGDNVRVAVLAGPTVLPRDKLTDVAALVMTRL